jgi:hypothetical protein
MNLGQDDSIWLMGALLAAIAVHHFVLLRRTPAPRRRAAGLARYPSLTVVRPIKGVDSGLEENLAAALDHGYPGEVETLFVFDHPAAPAGPADRCPATSRSSTAARPPLG